MSAEPLTPGQGLMAAMDNLERIMVDREKELDAARARIAELEGTAQEVQSFAENYKRERDEARAECEQWKEQARQFCQNADYWRAKAERAEPAVEAARAWNNASSDDGDEARRLERAVDALDAAEGK